MNIENLNAFIKYGIDDKKPKEKMILGAVLVSGFAMFACMDGLVYDLLALICTVALYLVSVAFIIVLSIVSRVLNTKTRVLCDSIITTFTVVVFSVSGYLYFYMNKIPYPSLISLLPIILALVSFLTVYIKVRTNRYIKKVNNPNYLNLAIFSGVGVIAGNVIVKIYANQIFELITADVLIGGLFLLIASAFAIMGAPSFLKLYYIKKLSSIQIDINE